MNIKNQPVITERFTEPGCRVTLFRDRENDNPEALALFRGGLGDIRSSSMGNIGCEVLKASEGEIAVGIVRTTRPYFFHKAFRDSVNARETRGDSMEHAIDGSLDHYPNLKSLVVAGHSQGGVTVVDGLLGAITSHREEGSEKLDDMRKGVLTMETPGVYGSMEYEGNIVQGLGRLAGNCIEDLLTMNNSDRVRMVHDMVRRGMSPFEGMHILGEIAYLKNIDISNEIESLRTELVEVWHSFRSGDVVDGAEVVSIHSRVRPGKHLRTVHGDGAEEAAADVVDMFTYLQNRPIAA